MKKLKGNDGVVRRFEPSHMDEVYGGSTETQCLECNHLFGAHTWSAYKDRLRKHVCGKEGGMFRATIGK